MLESFGTMLKETIIILIRVYSFPTTFKIYINELLDSFSKLDDGCRYGISILNILAYADDLVIFSSTGTE